MTRPIGEFGNLRGNSSAGHDHPSPNSQASAGVTLPASYYGCGDYPEWLAHEAGAWRKEQRDEHAGRFDQQSWDLPTDIYAIVDGQVVSAKTGLPFPPIQEQIAALLAQCSREQYIERRQRDAVTLKPILDLFSLVEGS